MASKVHSGSELVPGKFYRICALDPGDPNPTLHVGAVIACAPEQPGCVDPSNRSSDGLGVEWLADYLGADGFGTLITELEEVEVTG